MIILVKSTIKIRIIYNNKIIFVSNKKIAREIDEEDIFEGRMDTAKLIEPQL